MANLVVLTFDDTEQAGQAYDALKKAHRDGFLSIDDAAVIVKDESGKVDVHNRADSGTKWGAVGGGAIGLILGSVFFPVLGLAIGAIGGALVGKSLDMGVDKKFVKDVTEELKPGSSALFIMAGKSNPDAIAAHLRSFHGKVYQTSLSSEAEEALKNAIEGK